jgi:uncharacterized iron-regulated protein
MKRSIKLCAYILGFLLLGMPSVEAQQIQIPSSIAGRSPQTQSLSVFLNALAQADVVYLGETHDHEADHIAQLQIIQELYQRHPRLAIGMEMFQRPFQAVLDQYLSGDIAEDELRQRSQFDQRWGFPWNYYAPILRFAQAHRLPVLALNTPTEVTQRVASKGLDLLPESDRQWIPPISEIRTDSIAYRQFLRPIYEDFHRDEGMAPSFENFFLSQVLWDETMADGVATFLKGNPNHLVVVLTGQGHVVYGYGIPSRVARRLAETPHFSQRIVLLNPAPELRSRSGTIANYFWLTP